MNIRVIQNGKVKDPGLIAVRDEYVKRFRRYGSLRVDELKPKKNRSLWPASCACRVLLDERGDACDSEGFARRLQQWSMQDGLIAFSVGDAYGHDEQTRSEAVHLLRLSDMVLPHQLAHVLLIEQIYRAACILHNSPYHHA